MGTQQEVPTAEAPLAEETVTAELATVAPQSNVVTGRARDQWAEGNVALIKATVAKDCSDAELSMFLELCARYQLDPFAKQIWAAKMGGRLAIIVSRDGLLAMAMRNPDFQGIQGDTVHENDVFNVSRDQDGNPQIDHRYSGWRDRGQIVGGWAIVRRRNRDPTYFFAPFSEYKGRNVWDSNPSAMILKVAESMSLRKAFSISGVVGEDEVGYTGGQTSATAVPAGPNYGTDPIVADRLEALMDALEWTPRKRLVKLATLSDDERLALLADLEAEARAAGLAVASAATPSESEAPTGFDPPDEDDIPEAHVVDEPGEFDDPEAGVDGGGPLNG